MEAKRTEESKKLLQKLRDQLYSSNGSIRRQAGFHLSWMQEDGLETLKSVLFGNSSEATKNAAAYGMRKMRGRMKKMSLQILNEGVEHQIKTVRDVCKKALIILEELPPKPGQKPPAKKAHPRLKIKEIPPSLRIRRKPRVPTQHTIHKKPPRR